MGFNRWQAMSAGLVLACLTLATAAQAQDIKVTLLGTGDPDPVFIRLGPATLVEAGGQKLLFDCGRGTVLRLQQLGIPWSELDALFVTHLHSDHVVGIPDLFLTGWVLGRRVPLRVWGPAGTLAMMENLVKAFEFDLRIRPHDDLTPVEGSSVITQDIAQGVVYENAGIKVTAFDVNHGQVKPALGYRIDYAGRSVVLSGDTSYSDNLIRHAAGADVLIHEVCLADPKTLEDSEHERRVLAHHTTPQQAGEVFSRVRPRLAVFSHIVLLGDVRADEILALAR
jgi:ribonuclease Z